jgi:hypothetical protein
MACSKASQTLARRVELELRGISVHVRKPVHAIDLTDASSGSEQVYPDDTVKSKKWPFASVDGDGIVESQ